MRAERRSDWKTFGEDDLSALFLVLGSRIYEIDPKFREDLDNGCLEALTELRTNLDENNPTDLSIPAIPSPQSISLNVSSSCNLSCSYCYAGRGGFSGAQTLHMKWPVAKAAIDKLFQGVDRSRPITIGFIGGEPFVNRRLIHRIVDYASEHANLQQLDVRFSVTTNGSLLSSEDIALVRSHRFAVTFSIDGHAELHEAQRKGSNFEQIAETAQRLLADPGLAQVAARATVKQGEMSLMARYDSIRALGFEDIGFSPVRMGEASDKFNVRDWPRYLDEMISLGRRETGRLLQGKPTAFSNLMIALKKIRAGACSPYPCGAGGGYFSVGSTGKWYACHRSIGDPQFEMGDSSSLNTEKRSAFLKDRHVSAQTDCTTCWARYLCSGSCHQEQPARTEASCDFIRCWLEYCLDAYCRLERAGKFGS